MKRAILLPSIAAAMLLSACGGNQTGGDGESAPAASDGELVSQVVETEQGGYLMGNPEAPVRLTEYASLVCVHCRDFEQEAYDEIKAMVDEGKLAFEMRNFLLGGADLVPTLLARCAGPDRFFALTDAWYDDWDAQMQRTQEALSDQAFVQQLQSMDPSEATPLIAEKTNALEFFGARGISRDQAQACLTDEAELAQLEKLKELGIEEGVTGTPSFYINGEKFDFQGWPALKAELVAAGAS